MSEDRIARTEGDVRRLAPVSGSYRVRFVGPPEASVEMPWEIWELCDDDPARAGAERLWRAPVGVDDLEEGRWDDGMIDHEIVGPMKSVID